VQGRNGRERGMAKGGTGFGCSLFLVQKLNSRSSLQKPLPLVAAAKSCIYRRRGSGDVAAHGEQGTPGEIFKQGAWGFMFWEQHAVIVSCLKGRGALAACGKRNSVKTTPFSFFFLLLLYIYFFICGNPKISYNRKKIKKRLDLTWINLLDPRLLS